MILERAEITIVEGREDAFAARMEAEGRPLLAAVDGVRSIAIGRGIESPSRFLFLVEWTSVEAHAAWHGTPGNIAFRALFDGLTTGGSMEHFRFDTPPAAAPGG